MWLLRTGGQWRNLPDCWPPWQAVYAHFNIWKSDGTFERLNAALNELDRLMADRDALPSAVRVDSQLVKLAFLIGEDRGLDAHKRVSARSPERSQTHTCG
ncbi:transposase [Spirosoma agri]|uniref:transposase n=1 Tax=Spirosoma agri TaxID=1987381 RepID=UPI001FE283FD|nr:transposase [Spirosoma agri]